VSGKERSISVWGSETDAGAYSRRWPVVQSAAAIHADCQHILLARLKLGWPQFFSMLRRISSREAFENQCGYSVKEDGSCSR